MAKRLSNDSSIGDVLKHFIEQNKLEKGLNRISAEEAWKNVMGNGVNNYTKNIILKESTLYVELSSSVLREELSFGKEKIINMLNEEIGSDIIKSIVLR